MGGSISVAVCDDARAVKLFFRQVLEEDGDIRVVSATSTGREVVAAVARHRPDALLLDLLLPDVPEPRDLVRDLRARSPDTAIVLISNMPGPDLAEHAARIGADAWTPKAQRPEQLREAVRAVVAHAPEPR